MDDCGAAADDQPGDRHGERDDARQCEKGEQRAHEHGTAPAGASRPGTSGCRRREPHVGDPVALAALEARAHVLALERGRHAAQQRRIDVPERMDADHRIQPAVDLARDDRHDAAAAADMELAVRVPNA
jgi:hypothetical protein